MVDRTLLMLQVESLLKLQIELNISGNWDNEGTLLAGLICRWHNDVSILVVVQQQLLVKLIPWHKLSSFLIHKVFLIGWLAIREHIEADHAPDQAHSDCLFPGFLGPAQNNFDQCLWFSRVKLKKILGIVTPSEAVWFCLKLFVVQMTSSGALFSPFTG